MWCFQKFEFRTIHVAGFLFGSCRFSDNVVYAARIGAGHGHAGGIERNGIGKDFFARIDRFNNRFYE